MPDGFRIISMATDSSHRVIMGGGGVSTFSHLFYILSFYTCR